MICCIQLKGLEMSKQPVLKTANIIMEDDQGREIGSRQIKSLCKAIDQHFYELEYSLRKELLDKFEFMRKQQRTVDLRELYASQALTGLCANSRLSFDIKEVTTLSFKIADEMIKIGDQKNDT